MLYFDIISYQRAMLFRHLIVDLLCLFRTLFFAAPRPATGVRGQRLTDLTNVTLLPRKEMRSATVADQLIHCRAISTRFLVTSREIRHLLMDEHR